MAAPGPAIRAVRPASDPIIFRVEVDPSSGAAHVPRTGISHFMAGDFVQFTSNQEDTAIQFVVKSPCNHPAPREVFRFGLESAVLSVDKIEGVCKFDCGHVDRTTGIFVPWGGEGSHTPQGG